jgi:hypothetical protein
MHVFVIQYLGRNQNLSSKPSLLTIVNDQLSQHIFFQMLPRKKQGHTVPGNTTECQHCNWRKCTDIAHTIYYYMEQKQNQEAA